MKGLTRREFIGGMAAAIATAGLSIDLAEFWKAADVPERIGALAMVRGGTVTRLVAASLETQNLFVSSDRGVYWTRVEPPRGTTSRLQVSAAANKLHATDPTGRGAVLVSRDAGLTWSIDRGYPPLAQLVEAASGTCFATRSFGARGLFVLRAGCGWSEIDLRDTPIEGRSIVWLSDAPFAAAAPARVLVGFSPDGSKPTTYVVDEVGGAHPLGRITTPRLYGARAPHWNPTALITSMTWTESQGIQGPTYFASDRRSTIYSGSDMNRNGDFEWVPVAQVDTPSPTAFLLDSAGKMFTGSATEAGIFIAGPAAS